MALRQFPDLFAHCRSRAALRHPHPRVAAFTGLMLMRLAPEATGTARLRALPFVVGDAFNLTLDTDNE